MEVVVIAPEEDSHALDRSLRELLTRLEIDLDFRHVNHMTDSAFAIDSSGARPLAVVAIDLDADPVTVTFRDARTGHALGRREVPRSTTPNVTVETVAHIVQVGVEDITTEEAATGATPSSSAAPPPTNEPPPQPPPQQPPPAAAILEAPAPAPREAPPKAKKTGGSWGLDLGAFVDGNYVSSGSGLVVGGGAETSFAFSRGNLRPAIVLSGSYHAAFDESDAFVDQRVKLLALRLIPTLQLVGGNAWSVDAGAGVGIDTWFTSPSSSVVPSNLVHEGRADVDPIVAGLVTVHFSVASGTDLFLAFALPVDIAPHRYLDDVGGTNQTLFEPARVRPSLSFGFELTAIGKPAYTALAQNGAGK